MNALFKCVLILGAAVAAHGFALGSQDVVFHCYNRASPQISEPLLPTENSMMLSNCLSLSRKTIMTIHSSGDTVGGNFNAFVIPAHLAAEDVNVIAVDWSPGSRMYTEALGNAPQAGRVVASFLNILVQSFGYDANLIRIVGVGIGGHVAGIAARNVNREIPSIVAIDPSFHGWTHHPEILNPDDADVVEVLHATAGVFGYDYPLGDLDFYPNGGTSQTGCGNNIECSHTYAYAFYAESVTADMENGNAFVGTACEDYEQAIALQCDGARDAEFGGPAFKTGGSGIYTFLTYATPPFARG